jgi:hypothetical protein
MAVNKNVAPEFAKGFKWFAIRDPRKTMVVQDTIMMHSEVHVIFLTDANKTHVRSIQGVRDGWKPMPQFSYGDEIIMVNGYEGRFIYINDSVVVRIPGTQNIVAYGTHGTLEEFLKAYGPITGKGGSMAAVLNYVKKYV